MCVGVFVEVEDQMYRDRKRGGEGVQVDVFIEVEDQMEIIRKGSKENKRKIIWSSSYL